MGRGGRWPAGRGGGRGGPDSLGPGGRPWRAAPPPAPPAGQPKLDPKVIEQRRQNTASRLRRFLQPIRLTPSLAGPEAMAEFNELMQVCLHVLSCINLACPAICPPQSPLASLLASVIN